MSFTAHLRRLAQLETQVQQAWTQCLEQMSDAALAAAITRLETLYGPIDPAIAGTLDTLPEAELEAVARGDPRALQRVQRASQWRGHHA